MLTPEEQHEINQEIKQYEHKDAVCIDALRIVQKNRGWISDGTLAEIAQFLEMTTGELDSIATFYNLIFRKPVGKKVIFLCDSVSCWIMGCNKIRKEINTKLSIDYGETTKDGEFTLLPIACLGHCEHAPAVMINQEVYKNMDSEKLKQALNK